MRSGRMNADRQLNNPYPSFVQNSGQGRRYGR